MNLLQEPSELTFRVRSDRVLFVEGTFDVGFFRAVLVANHRRRVQIDRLDGEGGLRAKLLARSSAADFETVNWIGVALDADRDANGQWQSARDAIEAMTLRRFDVPTEAWTRSAGSPETGSATVIVFPGDGQAGRIESFLREGLRGSLEAPCVDLYVDCLGEVGALPEAVDKVWVYAFLASRARPGQTLSASARAGHLPIDLPGYGAFLSLIPRDDEEL